MRHNTTTNLHSRSTCGGVSIRSIMDGESIPDQSVAGDISLWGGGPLDPEDCIRSLAWGDGLWNDSPWSHWREEYYPRVGDSRIAWAQDFYERHWTFCQNVSDLAVRVV